MSGMDALKSLGRSLPGPVKSVLRSAYHRRGAFIARRELRREDTALGTEWAPYRRPVSIVIPSYNDVPLLTACLASIEKTCQGIDYEVIVVDDYCQPENSERLARLAGGRVRVIFKEERGGFAVTVNRGMREAQHDIILLNSDIVALPGWVEALQLAAFGGDPAIGLVSPRLLYPDGRIQYGGTFWGRTWVPQWFAHRWAGHLANYAPSKIAGYNWGASGACLYIPRATYDVLGGLDEEYWLGFEDVDYAMRGWEAGIRSYYAPRATLFHHESATRGYHQGNRELGSMRLFWSKWAHLHRSKTDGTPTREVDLVVSPDDDALWREYVAAAATGLRDHGWTVRMHEVTPHDQEALVADLAPRRSLKVAASRGALQAVWLGSVLAGIAVHLVRDVDRRPSPQTLAALAPEFEYLVPNRWSATVLESTTSWPASDVVAPALPATVPAAELRRGAVVVTDDDRRDAPLLTAVRILDPEAVVVVTGDDRLALRALEDAPARALVDLRPARTSLFPLAAMATGAVVIALENEVTTFEVRNGENALLIRPGDVAGLEERLQGLLYDDMMFESLSRNGRSSAADAAAAAIGDLAGALETIARRRA